MPRRRTLVHLVLGFIAAVLLVEAFVGEKGFLERRRARETYRQTEARLKALRAENARLRATAVRYKDDPKAKEALAREALGYVGPDEVLFVIRDLPPRR